MCSYSDSSQLAAAADFLAAHRGRIALVTLDIGANDVDGCVSAAGIDNACVAGGIAAAGANLPVILGALQAADPGVRVVGMNYESGTNWGRLRCQRLSVGHVGESWVPPVEVVDE